MSDSRLSARSLQVLLGEWRGDAPAYQTLADSIRVLCLDRRIVVGTALPAERELASVLGLSRTTVAAAYRTLRGSRLIESVRGSGSVVRSPSRGGSAPWSVPSVDGGRPIIDLQQASPPAWPGLPQLFAAAMERIDDVVARPGYELRGASSLREAIARRYSDAGLPTTVDQIVVTTGAQNAIALIAATLVGRGDRVAIETPTYPHAAETFRRAGARLVPLPVDPRAGWDLDRSEQVLRRGAPVLAYLMPDFQNPTGRTMTVEERSFFLDSLWGSAGYLVVDETTAELDIDRRSPWRPFGAGADEALLGRIITVGSLGKSVWGGLRVGWIRAGEDILHRILASRPALDLGTPEFEQLVALGAIERMPEILAQRGRALGAGRDALVGALRRELPEWEVPDVPGGVALWIGLGAPSSSRLVLAARERGVILSSGTRFGVDGGHERRLRVPFTASPDVLGRAALVLSEAWRGLSASAVSDREPSLAVV